MRELIYKDEAYKAIDNCICDSCYRISPADAKMNIRHLVSDANEVDRPQGAWIEMGQNEDGTHNVKCNQCDSTYKMRGHAKSISTKLKYRFCPHCGARMKGADNE